MPRHHKFSNEQWSKHKSLIQHLWLEQDCSFASLAEELAKVGFEPSKRQFEFQAAKWGWSKYMKTAAKEQLLKSLLEHKPQVITVRQIKAFLDEGEMVEINSHHVNKRSFCRWLTQHQKSAGRSDGERALRRHDLDNREKIELMWPIISLPRALDPYPTMPSSVVSSLGVPPRHSLSALSQSTFPTSYDYAATEAQHGEAAMVQQTDWHTGYPPMVLAERQMVVGLVNMGRIEEAHDKMQSMLQTQGCLVNLNASQRLSMMITGAAVRGAKGDLDVAQSQFRDTLQVAVTTVGWLHNCTLSALAGLANVLRMQDQLKASEALYSQLLGLRRHIALPFELCQELRQLADVLSDSGRIVESMKLYRAAEEMAVKHLGSSHHISLRIRSNTAADLRIAGYLEESEELLAATLSEQRRTLGEDHPDVYWTLYQRAKCLLLMERYDDALGSFKCVAEYRRQRLGEAHIRTINCNIWLGWCSERMKLPEAALAHYRTCLSGLPVSLDSDSYSFDYRIRWLKQAEARNMTDISADEGQIQLGTLRPLEITNKDGSPVQCIIEEESSCPETCPVLS